MDASGASAPPAQPGRVVREKVRLVPMLVLAQQYSVWDVYLARVWIPLPLFGSQLYEPRYDNI